jgi:hypothetical protein
MWTRRVNGETRRVHRVLRAAERVPVHVDLDQARSGDLLEHHVVGVDEEMVFRPGNAGRKMGKNQVVPPVKRDKAIRRSQVDADLPFARRHVLAGIDRG